MVDTTKCPCGSDLHYNDCCRAFHDSQSIPKTAQELMRSRYSAYVKKNISYLLETWHESSRPTAQELEPSPEFRWVELEVIATDKGLEEDDTGIVHFKAQYKFQGNLGAMEEKSNFVKENGRWYYTL